MFDKLSPKIVPFMR